MDIKQGDIVISLQGRDKGRPFIVLMTEGEYLYLADGRLRKAEKPKKKKIKHLRFEARPDIKVSNKIREGERIHSSDLRKGLSEYYNPEEA